MREMAYCGQADYESLMKWLWRNVDTVLKYYWAIDDDINYWSIWTCVILLAALVVEMTIIQ
jgi:hypothetical protein